MAELIDKMKINGQLTLATNQLDYFEEAKESFESLWHFQLIEAGPLSPNTSPRSHFEKKYLKRGETCYNIICQRDETSLNSETVLR